MRAHSMWGNQDTRENTGSWEHRAGCTLRVRGFFHKAEVPHRLEWEISNAGGVTATTPAGRGIWDPQEGAGVWLEQPRASPEQGRAIAPFLWRGIIGAAGVIAAGLDARAALSPRQRR